MFDITSPVVQLLGIGSTLPGAGSLTAESDLSASMLLGAAAGSVLTAESDGAAAAVIGYVAAVALDADSGVTADATHVIAVATALAADSQVTVAASLTAFADAAASFESALAADGFGVLVASVSMSASCTLTTLAGIVNGAAALANGGSNLVANGVRVQLAVANPMPLSVDGSFACFVSHPLAGRPFAAGSDLEATMYMNPRLLVLPTVEFAFSTNVLLRRYPIDNGRALLITDGVGELVDFPAQREIRLADYYFPGGRRIELTADEEAAVVAAGFGDLIVTEFLP